MWTETENKAVTLIGMMYFLVIPTAFLLLLFVGGFLGLFFFFQINSCSLKELKGDSTSVVLQR